MKQSKSATACIRIRFLYMFFVSTFNKLYNLTRFSTNYISCESTVQKQALPRWAVGSFEIGRGADFTASIFFRIGRTSNTFPAVFVVREDSFFSILRHIEYYQYFRAK